MSTRSVAKYLILIKFVYEARGSICFEGRGDQEYLRRDGRSQENVYLSFL
jgi:hypothetical protein